MSLLTQGAAARSAARRKKKSSPPPPESAPPAPSGVLKTSPRGTHYRVYTVSLADLPGFLEREGFEPKAYFHFLPEERPRRPNETKEEAEERYRSGFVLGVRRKDDKEAREL